MSQESLILKYRTYFFFYHFRNFFKNSFGFFSLAHEIYISCDFDTFVLVSNFLFLCFIVILKVVKWISSSIFYLWWKSVFKTLVLVCKEAEQMIMVCVHVAYCVTMREKTDVRFWILALFYDCQKYIHVLITSECFCTVVAPILCL